MKEKVWNFMTENHMLMPGDKIVVGVSGGGDSMALLAILDSLKERGAFTLAALHVNHGLRGDEALRDQQVVEEYCRHRRLLCKSVQLDVAKLAKEQKISVEEAGRTARFLELTKFAAAWGGTKIALAHHKNDLAETVLHHLARGAGLRGMAGIRPVNGPIIRPFLGIEKREIVHYLYTENIPWEMDGTNLTDDYTRNRIRHHVLDYLEKQINTKAVEHIAAAARIAKEADCYLTKQGEELLHLHSRRQNGGICLEESFFQAPHILQMYGILAAAGQLLGSRRDLTETQFFQTVALFQKPVSKKIPLGQGLWAERTYEGVYLSRGEPAVTKKEWKAAFLQPDRKYPLPGGMIKCRSFPYKFQEIIQKKYTQWFDYDKIEKNIQVRCRKDGDYLIVTREGGKKRLKDYFINEKIPQKERAFLPLICQGSEVLWVIGYRRSESARITANTRTILEITYEGGRFDEQKDSCFDQRGGSRSTGTGDWSKNQCGL